MSEAPTLELREATLRRAGATLGPALSLRSEARRIAWLGAWEPWFEALSGQAELASGSARVLGCDWEAALQRGVLGFAACDPPLPASFSVTQYLRHAARLSHGSASRAEQDEKRALARFGLAELAPKKLAQLALHEKRALGVATATLTAPEVVCLEAPLRGLDVPSAEYLARLCAEAGRGTRLIVSGSEASSLGPERNLLESCDEVCVLHSGALVLQGPPGRAFAAGSRYWFRIEGRDLDGFAQALTEAGCRLSAGSSTGSYSIELPPHASSDLLLDTALAHAMVVLELEPVLGAT